MSESFFLPLNDDDVPLVESDVLAFRRGYDVPDAESAELKPLDRGG